MWRGGQQRVDTSELRRIVREELDLGEDDTITVSEMACTKAGCPPMETVISIFPAGEESYLIRVCKAIPDVEPMDVLTALAFGDHREGFDPTRFL
jgi:hypothetical protein